MSYIQQAMPTASPGSITSLMDSLTALQVLLPTQVIVEGSEPLHLYRWRPNTPDAPALYNILLPSTSEIRDLSRIRDTFRVATRIGVTLTDYDQLMGDVEMYVDAYRALVDANYWDGSQTPQPLRNSATWAIRSSIQSMGDDFGSVTLLGFEVTQEFWLDRHIR